MTLTSYIMSFINVINGVLLLLSTCSIVVFLWGMVKFIARVGGDENEIKNGKQLMIWGIISIFVIFSVYGILNFLYGNLSFPTQISIPPRLPES